MVYPSPFRSSRHVVRIGTARVSTKAVHPQISIIQVQRSRYSRNAIFGNQGAHYNLASTVPRHRLPSLRRGMSAAPVSPRSIPFPYEPLEAGQFRLVYVKPSSDPDASLSLILAHATPTDGQYVALSYTWGAPFHGLPPEWDDPTATRRILVNGHPFDVRWNLEAAIRRLSSTECKNPPITWIWIDAICINQIDLEERNSQVRMMKSIYKKAKATIAWLGPESEDSDLALQSIRDYHTSWVERTNELRFIVLRERDHDEYTLLAKKEILALESHARITSIGKLMLRYWWLRAWVAQEVVLAPHIVLLCGASDPVGWAQLTHTFLIFEQHCCMAKEDRLGMMNEELSTLLGAVSSTRPFTDLIRPSLEKRAMRLPEALDELKPFLAADARDKVYAALGLTVDADLINVDYRCELTEVLTQACRSWTEQNMDLSMLSYCQPSSIPGLPTWVPDWTGDINRLPILQKGINGHKNQVFSAGGDTSPYVRFEKNQTMVLKGIPCDMVTFVAPSSMNRFRKSQTMKALFEMRKQAQKKSEGVNDDSILRGSWLKSWIRSSRYSTSWPGVDLNGLTEEEIPNLWYSYTQETLSGAYFRTLVTDIFTSSHGFYLGRTGFYRDKQVQTPEGLITPFGLYKGADDLFDLILFTMTSVLRSRTFLATRGGLIALGPAETKEGDVIFVIQGSETPFLLRPQEDGQWNFVGGCYVHGIMDGELVQDFQKPINPENWTMRLEEYQRHRATTDSNIWAEVRIK